MESKQCDSLQLITNVETNDYYNEKNSMIKESIIRNNDNLKKLWTVSVLCVIFMTIEIIGGYLAKSIAIMADAAHLLSDVLGFVISIVSIYISRKQATLQMSYGFHRAEIIGALVSVNIIWGLTIWLLYEATLRLINPTQVNGFIMLITAIIGFFFNIVMGVVLAYEGIDHKLHSHDHYHEDEEDGNEEYSHSHNEEHSHKIHEGEINLRAAFVHVIGDALQNLGVVIAGLIIYFWPHLSIADPICTYIFSIIIIFTTIRILRECIAVLMEGSPVDYNIDRLSSALKKVPFVKEIHDLHVWSLSVGKLSLSCHMTSSEPQLSLKKASEILRNEFGISHFTVQVEADSSDHKYNCTHDLH